MKGFTRDVNIYRVVGGGLDFEAPLSEVARKLNTTKQNVYKGARKGKLDIYRIIDTGKTQKMRVEYKAKPKQVSRISFDDIVVNLKNYGNCFTPNDPCCYLPDLYDKGFDCTYREATALKGYVLEVRNYL